jgi:glycosyltransferase involved in cell wall biosynthesis
LYLGTLKPSKNVEGLLRAFQLVVDNRRSLASNLRLVIVGKKGWMYEQIYKLVHQLKLGNLVIFTDFLPEVDKPALLKGAQVLVSPSFWEGFGLHVLESMACGTPVVASNRGSFPEIVEEAGVLVDPTSVTEIAGGIRQVLALNQKEMAVLKEKMELQAKKFTWEKASLKTLDAIKRVIDVE